MRAAWLVAGALLLAGPVASAWPAQLRSPVDEWPHVRTSLLLAGGLNVTTQDAPFGMALARSVTFSADAVLRVCEDRNGAAVSADACPENQTYTRASLEFIDGGFVAGPAGGDVGIEAPAAVAALGGANVTVNQIPVGPGAFVGGEARVWAAGDAFFLRPVGDNLTLIVAGREGLAQMKGTGYSLFVAQAGGIQATGEGAFAGLDAGQVDLTRAPLDVAERSLRVDALHALLLRILPPERLERRADLAGAFGPFQVVPALLDGAIAGRENLTVSGSSAASMVLRVENATLRREGDNWTGAAEAAYVVRDGAVAPALDDDPAPPVVVPLALIALAAPARWRTRREVPPRRRRLVAALAGVAGALFLVALAAVLSAATLGASFWRDAASLSWRSFVQLALLSAVTAALAWLVAGFALASLARSVFAWRARPQARVWPRLVGVAGGAVALWVWTAALVALAARFVRL